MNITTYNYVTMLCLYHLLSTYLYLRLYLFSPTLGLPQGFIIYAFNMSEKQNSGLLFT